MWTFYLWSFNVKASPSTTGLNWGQGKFGPQRWFIFIGMCTFLGTNRHLLVFGGQGLRWWGTVSGDFFSLAMAQVQCESRIRIYREALYKCWCDRCAGTQKPGGGYSRTCCWRLVSVQHEESKSCFILFLLDKYLWVHYEVTPTDRGLWRQWEFVFILFIFPSLL